MIRALIRRICLGEPRPCGDDECVAAAPEDHGLEVVAYDGFGAPIYHHQEES